MIEKVQKYKKSPVEKLKNVTKPPNNTGSMCHECYEKWVYSVIWEHSFTWLCKKHFRRAEKSQKFSWNQRKTMNLRK